MANYCSNSVLFVGDEQSVAQIKSLFEEIEKKQTKSGQWHMPSFIEGNSGFILDIVIDKRAINYETRWYRILKYLHRSLTSTRWGLSASSRKCQTAFMVKQPIMMANSLQ